MLQEAFLAGMWGSVGSSLGKLSGTSSIVVKKSIRSGAGAADIHVPKLWYYSYLLFLANVDVCVPRPSRSIHSIFDDMPFEYAEGDSYVISGVLLVLMVVANTWGCRHYLRSMDAASNSVAPTVISAASSYVLSGVIGIAVFEEGASWRWWLGTVLITAGLALVARPRDKQHTE